MPAALLALSPVSSSLQETRLNPANKISGALLAVSRLFTIQISHSLLLVRLHAFVE